MYHLAKIYEHAPQPHNALHAITPAVVPRARLTEVRERDFLFENHRFEAKIDDFLVFEHLQAELRFFTFLRHGVELWRVLLSPINL